MVVASFVALAASMLAGPPDGGGEPPAESPTAVADEGEDDPRKRAKQAFDRGLEAVALGEFAAAVEYFESAYDLRPHPVTLFNLALALEKAGRLPEAWELFDAVVEVVESDAERREVRRHMRAIAADIAIVEVHATPQRRLCLDGIDMPTREDGYRLAITPGRHQVILDEHEFTVELDGGDHRVLLLDDVELLVDDRRRSRLAPAMLGSAIASGSLALGLGVAAASIDADRPRTGLAASAAASAGTAVVFGVVALLIETRKIRDRTVEPEVEPAPDCPGSEQLEKRLDLELGPKLERPATFTLEALPPPTHVLPLPRPRLGIRPPRASAQNEPESTTPK